MRSATPSRCKFWLATALLLPAGAAAAPIAVDGPACFTEKDNAALSFEVIQQAPPPKPGESNYEFYPLTGTASMQMGTLAAGGRRYATYYFQWANRSNAPLLNARGMVIPRKPNFQQTMGKPRKQRTAFTSLARANACTLAQTATALGRAEDARRYALANGITLMRENLQADSGVTGPDDTCVSASGSLPKDAAGVLLDYEVQDKRSPAETLDFLREYAGLVHKAGRKAILLTNPLDAPSQKFTGITAENAHTIVSLFDRTTIFLWSRNKQKDLAARYAAQKALIEAGGPFDGSRILLDFELMGTNLDDARLARQLILSDKLAGVLLWRNYAKQGGSCASPTNVKIAMLTLGKLK